MGNRSQEQHTLLTDYDTNSAYTEALRTLFANIRFHWESDSDKHAQAHSLLVTTPSAYGDFGAVTANLAIVAAQSGTPTILVDANLREPQFQQRFGLEKPTGLSDLLADELITSERIAASLQSTFIPGLRVLGAGTAKGQAASLLSSRLEVVVQCLCKLPNEAENKTGIVIFHSPPVLAGADASLIGALVDYTALTVIVNRTTQAHAKRAQEQLQQAHAKIVGIVLLNL